MLFTSWLLVLCHISNEGLCEWLYERVATGRGLNWYRRNTLTKNKQTQNMTNTIDRDSIEFEQQNADNFCSLLIFSTQIYLVVLFPNAFFEYDGFFFTFYSPLGLYVDFLCFICSRFYCPNHCCLTFKSIMRRCWPQQTSTAGKCIQLGAKWKIEKRNCT